MAEDSGAPEVSDRERQELLRTRRALSQEIDDLLRQKAALSAEVDALLVERSTSEIKDALDNLSESNRRFFLRVIEREIHRCARETGARFSVVELESEAVPPTWFSEFLTRAVRLSDLAVRAGPRTWLLFLSGAGSLGRRLFVSRFARLLRGASAHHQQTVGVRMGGATYPADGDTGDDLVSQATDRLAQLLVEEDLTPTELDPARRPRSSMPVQLLPPDGVIDTGPAEADPSRVIEAIQAAATTAQGGELVVRSEEVVGRVYIWKGKIAWAHCTSRDVSLAEYLVEVGGADRDEVKFAFEHCRQTGANFAETLIEFGTFERREMRQVLCSHLRAHLDAILQLPAPELLFLPQSRVYGSDLLFPLSALLANRERPAKRKIIDRLRDEQSTGALAPKPRKRR